MEFPFYLRVAGLRVHPHWFFETLAYVVAFRLYLRLRKRAGDPIREPARWWVIAAAAAGAAIGSKVLYWLEDPRLTLHRWSDPAYLMAGKTIVGALIGGLLAVEWTKWRIGVKDHTGDLFALPLCVGIAIGRIGCFLTGLSDHTYGTPTRFPWGVDFGDGVARHPTQLYESVFVLLLGAFLWRLSKREYRQGDLFKIFMVAYLGFRLAVDFWKPGVRFAQLSMLQWACFAMILYYARDIVRWLGWVHQESRGLTAASGQQQSVE
jgi:phosphatidylglycerol:prolipoprotein diacylglycerol transferase